MTKEDITQLAQVAGWDMPTEWVDDGFAQRLERFAALVAAAEREACAQVCEQIANDYDGSPAGTGADNCATEIRSRK